VLGKFGSENLRSSRLVCGSRGIHNPSILAPFRGFLGGGSANIRQSMDIENVKW
jgi:hypothetical protein